MPFAIGDTVGPYRIVDQIGQGGMATVFKAYHANLDRYVRSRCCIRPSKKTQIFLNVSSAKHKSSLNWNILIVPVYDFDDVDEQPYLVMKFIEGETLKARLKHQPLTLDETIHILEVVAHGLTYAHGQGILHATLNPRTSCWTGRAHPILPTSGWRVWPRQANRRSARI